VSDTGVGIAPSDSDRVFDEFERAAGDDIPGPGLGLAIVKELCRVLDGQIDFVSREGIGHPVIRRRRSDQPSATIWGENAKPEGRRLLPSLAVARARERASGEGVVFEGVVFPVNTTGLRCRLGGRPAWKFKVPDGLSRTDGLFKPLRHLTFTAPGITTCATVATCIRSRRPIREQGSEVVWADAEVIHAVAEIRNHAVPLPFVHKAFL
jgi:hypothetical protein